MIALVKPRIVFDTNALASAAILPDSTSGGALTWAIAHFQLMLSAPVIGELVEVLQRPKLARYFEGDAMFDFLLTVARVSEIVDPSESIGACRDPKDNKLLELAVAAQARYLVTGDKDLLALHPFRGIEILPAGILRSRFADFTMAP